MLHLILYQPEIPPNTGNIIRLCANTGCALHLIEPLGFSMQASALRRAGLDYHELAHVSVHPAVEDCLQRLAGSRLFCVETVGGRAYSEAHFQPDDALLFGPETRGLPAALLNLIPPAQRLAIPMRPGNRSLNLSNAVAVVVYEAWRQLGYPGASRAPA
ncbi:MAG: tRNA (cytidine(34)-2'-O)-methyltransferase [Sinobacteraceae bacterium]|nr:tRNA (cytidine(34)-2'-O)-methyltransferase [Nevskiaceae bacterium]